MPWVCSSPVWQRPRRCPSLGTLAAAAAVAHWTHVGEGVGAWAAHLPVPAWQLLLRAASRQTSARPLAQVLERWPLPVVQPLAAATTTMDHGHDNDDDDDDDGANLDGSGLQRTSPGSHVDGPVRAHEMEATVRQCLVVLETAHAVPAQIDLGDYMLHVPELTQLARVRQRSGPPVTLLVSVAVSPAAVSLVRNLWAPPDGAGRGSTVRVVVVGVHVQALAAAMTSEVLQALVRQGPIAPLRRLVLDRCEVDADALGALVATPHGRALQEIHILYTEPPATLSWAALLAALPALTVVCLHQSAVLSAPIVARLVALLGAAAQLPSLHSLDVNVGAIPALDWPQVAAALAAVATAAGTHLRVLRLGGMLLAPEGGRHGALLLAGLPRTAWTLTTVALVACRLNVARFATDVAPALAGLAALRHLDLSGNVLLLPEEARRGGSDAAASDADQRRHLGRFLDALASAVGSGRARKPALRTLTLRYVAFNVLVLHGLLDRWLPAPDVETVYLSPTWLVDNDAQPQPQSLRSVVHALQARIPPQYPYRLALVIQ